tara:strand:+ start:383 stop:826 length:444 start_codon:yes stop_codon:yes gene_type:complete
MNDIGGAILLLLISMGGLITYTYNNLEYKGYPSISSCTGECYQEYLKREGTIAEQLEKKRAAAADDPFSSVRGLWAGCAACHGQQGQGMGMFPALAGRDSEYIIDRLTTYKNRGEVGKMSATMWSQASLLSDRDIDTIGKFIEETLK